MTRPGFLLSLNRPIVKASILSILFVAILVGKTILNAPVNHDDPSAWTESNLTRAAGRGDTIAQMALGVLYQTGDNGFPEDHELARKYYAMAAEAGVAEGAWNAAMMEQERGDVRAAIKYLYAAHSGGVTQATYRLGKLLVRTGDLKTALPLLEKSAAKKDTDAMAELGYLWNHDSELGSRDIEKALFWMTLAFQYEQDSDKRWSLEPSMTAITNEMKPHQYIGVVKKLQEYASHTLKDRVVSNTFGDIITKHEKESQSSPDRSKK